MGAPPDSTSQCSRRPDLSRDGSRYFFDPLKLFAKRQKALRGSRELSIKMRTLLCETRELLIKRPETSRSSRESFGDSRESSRDTKKSPRVSIRGLGRSIEAFRAPQIDSGWSWRLGARAKDRVATFS
jgi:hypothetical protein